MTDKMQVRVEQMSRFGNILVDQTQLSHIIQTVTIAAFQ
jgi:hypothetical protein